ncbi:MAG: alpha/beta hydrolase-fold protein [Bacteroidota bacterium]
MKKNIVLSSIFLLSILVAVVLTIYIVDSSDTPSSFNTHIVQSKVLNEEREIIVRTPRGYSSDSSENYPVIYVFGGNSLTFSISNDLDLLIRTGHSKRALVVGVPNISQETRQRDLTPPFLKQDLDEKDSPQGQADFYLNFVETEVIPLIEKNYRTSSERVAVGHSREGLMVMYSIMVKPKLFNGHLALSPALWREENHFVDVFRAFIQESDTIPSKVFLTMGELEVDKMKNAFDLTADILKASSEKANYRSLYFSKANHGTNPYLTSSIGLDWILNKANDSEQLEKMSTVNPN